MNMNRCPIENCKREYCNRSNCIRYKDYNAGAEYGFLSALHLVRNEINKSIKDEETRKLFMSIVDNI